MMSSKLFLSIALVMGCTNKEPIEEVYSSCDPLDTSICALPFPSSFYEREAQTPSGVQVTYAADSLPLNRDFVQLDPTAWNERDGHSIGSPVLTYFEDVSTEGTISHEDIGAYAAADAKTFIVDTSTGERVPHWVEMDGTAKTAEESLFILRPAIALNHATRYVVGIRGLEKNSGGAVDSSEAFLALRDDVETTNWDIEGRRSHFDKDVFPFIVGQGVAREELQLAWDFTTASRENSVGRMEWMRDDALVRFGASGPPYVITSVEEKDCSTGATMYKSIEGTFTAPLYTDIDGPGSVLTQGDDGLPYYNGDTEVKFVARIPCSLKNEPEEAFLLQYGHGLLGSHSEAKTGWMSRFINKNKYIVFAVSWTGMKAEDRGPITVMVVSDPSGFRMIPERSMQGLVEQIGAMRMMLGAMAEDPHFNIDGVQLINTDDIERRGYYGNSQGGIMGAAYSAVSPDISRAVFGVGGMPYSLLLPRSYDFDPFFRIFDEKYDDHREKMFIITGLLEQLWDVADPTAWAWDFTSPPPGMPEKQVLMQTAIGDAQVSTIGAQIQARTYGASLVAPETRPVWGLEAKEGPFVGNALVEWRYTDIPDEPYETVPAEVSTDPHECPRREPAAQSQIKTFFETGIIEQFCEGSCEGVQAGCY